MLNLELLQGIRDKVMFEPEQHDQAHWMIVQKGVSLDLSSGFTEVSCPTAACVAGWACLLAGDMAVVDGDVFVRDDQTLSIERVRDSSGAEHYIEDRATSLLGLDLDEAEDLFDADNDRRYVLDRLDELIVLAKEERNQL